VGRRDSATRRYWERNSAGLDRKKATLRYCESKAVTSTGSASVCSNELRVSKTKGAGELALPTWPGAHRRCRSGSKSARPRHTARGAVETTPQSARLVGHWPRFGGQNVSSPKQPDCVISGLSSLRRSCPGEETGDVDAGAGQDYGRGPVGWTMSTRSADLAVELWLGGQGRDNEQATGLRALWAREHRL